MEICVLVGREIYENSPVSEDTFAIIYEYSTPYTAYNEIIPSSISFNSDHVKKEIT